MPDGGWRYVGRVQGRRNRAATPDTQQLPRPLLGTAFVHRRDDHSRVAYAEIRDDETAATAVDVPRRVVAWFAAPAVTADRVLTDNGSAYRSRQWNRACDEPAITPKKTRRKPGHGPRGECIQLTAGRSHEFGTQQGANAGEAGEKVEPRDGPVRIAGVRVTSATSLDGSPRQDTRCVPFRFDVKSRNSGVEVNQTSEIDAVQQLLAGHMDAERPSRTDQDDDYTVTNEEKNHGQGIWC